jgi:hypothetical protein
VCEEKGVMMTERVNVDKLFVSGEGVCYRLFVHNCLEKKEIANLIEVSKHSQIFYID